MRTTLLLASLFIFLTGHAQTSSLPKPFYRVFKTKGLDAQYELDHSLKPAYLQADWNGDGSPDIATIVMDKTTQKKGILVIHGKTGAYFVFGAGTRVAGMDDLSWIDGWKIYRRKTVDEPRFDKRTGDVIGGRRIKIGHPALLLEHEDESVLEPGGILCWTGKGYRWIHQGD